jgi:hypothetical protein
MCHSKKLAPLIVAMVVTVILSPVSLKAADPIEAAGVGVGLTVGNAIFVPMKAISVGVGWFFGGLSFVLSGGNADLTKQIWSDVTEGPYVITPELAHKAVGERPELERK